MFRVSSIRHVGRSPPQNFKQSIVHILIFISVNSKPAAFLAFCLMATILGGCDDKLERASEFATIAEQQFTAGDIDAARSNVQKAIAARDDVAAYYVLLGQIEVQSQKPISAFNAFSLALDLEADNLQILQSIADLGLQTGRVKEAKEAAERILILAPGSPNALLVKGFIALDEGRFDEAQTAANDILTLDPQDEGGIILSARIDALQGRSEIALAKINKTIATIGETSALNATRLEIYRLLGQPARLLETMPAILKNVDANSEYQIDYINLLYKTGNLDAARNTVLKVLEDPITNTQQLTKLMDIWSEYDPTPLTASQISRLAKNGSPVMQITLARHLLLSEPQYSSQMLAGPLKAGRSEAKALLVRIMLEEGDTRAAYGIADQILKNDPRNEDALLVRSARFMAEKKFDEAIADANVVVSDAPQNVFGYVMLGNALSAKGNKIRARQVFEQGIDALPQSRILAKHYKERLLGWGDKRRIVSLDKEVAMATPSSIKSWVIFADSCSRFGDGSCAKEANQGLARAKTSFVVDDPPGTPRRRGLFARITPEKICATTGGICTES